MSIIQQEIKSAGHPADVKVIWIANKSNTGQEQDIEEHYSYILRHTPRRKHELLRA